ncbi:DUF2589 domain-containing protein [uncultured Psychrosphaera sp.]|jgi:hypothetical protein|uniref:DUF2589 domain-containing protein n=1 Tax=uncultured Psychrosphaera sp. TaxID=1403522 RepID=UPI002619834B|nr:DUF2589 domain-containing protein [uncultured Psychrosphaera sp.]
MVDQNKKLVSMAKQFSGLPMKELIGAPLVAATQANNMMAITQTKFLLETCFFLKKQGDKEIYKPIMINMTLTRQVINADGSAAESVETDFNLPLLTIIPLNSLAVDDINVSFEMEVKSSFTSDSSSDASAENKDENSISRKINNNNISAELSGSVAASESSNSSDKSSFKKSNSAKYEIKAHAGQIPLPVGVTTIIETFSKSMAPIHLKAENSQQKNKQTESQV